MALLPSPPTQKHPLPAKSEGMGNRKTALSNLNWETATPSNLRRESEDIAQGRVDEPSLRFKVLARHAVKFVGPIVPD